MIVDVKNILYSNFYNYSSKDNFKEIISDKIDNATRHFLSLGCFDRLSIIDIELDNPECLLNEIENINTQIFKNVIDDCCFYPMSCFATDDLVQPKQIVDFWKDPSPFLCTVFISFCEQDSNTKNEKFLSLQNSIKETSSIIYKTLNAVDAIVFLKSNSVSKILTSIEEINQNSGIEYESYIINIDQEEKNCKPFDKDNIDISVELVGKNKTVISQIGKRIEKEVECNFFNPDAIYFDNGNYSTLRKVNLSSEKIYQYANLIKRFKEKNIEKNLQDSFDNILSLKTNINFYFSVNWSQKSNILKNKYIELENDYMELIENLSDFLPWIKTLGSLLSTLTAMSNNFLFDPVCTIFYKNMRYIIKSFREIIKNKNLRLINAQTNFIQRVIRGCWLFIENVLRKDMVYIKNANILPLPYNVDVKLIEYYHCVFYNAVRYLTEIDKQFLKNSTNCDDVCCLIVPKICRRMKTHLHNEPTLDMMLFIDLPINILHNPLLAIEEIVHETAHGWGDFTRCREERREGFCKCLSIEIAYKLGLYNNAVAKMIYNYLASNFNETNLYLDQLYKTLKNAMHFYLLDENLTAQMISTYVSEKSNETNRNIDNDNNQYEFFEELENEVNKIQNRITETLKYKKVDELVWDIYNYYKEGYADLMMIKLLDLSPQQYLEMFIPEIKGCDTLDQQAFLLIQRISMVASVAFNNRFIMFASKDNKQFFCDELNRYYNKIRRSNGNLEVANDLNYYNFEVVTFIIRYLKCCLTKFKETQEAKLLPSNNLKPILKNVVNCNNIFEDDFYRVLTEIKSIMLD